MSTSESDNESFSPPLFGGGEWLSFYPFPCQLPEGIQPWFAQFAGMQGTAVRDELRREWQDIRQPDLNAFAEAMLKYNPYGILHSRYADWIWTTWLVLSRNPPYRGLADQIANRESTTGLRYLTAPQTGQTPAGIGLDDLLLDFFRRFGGLRLDSPFMSGYFYDWPCPPIRIDPEELDKFIGSDWEGAEAVFVSDTSDELLVSRSGRVGWFLHDIRQIKSAGTFEDILKKAATEEMLGPYFE